ncbi:MAG: Spo0B domain-containing protein [Peptococcaceae bacterium]|nr:Spo0B domain-containing protein [Peptococcaceae bacterium]MDH7525540.1 Spo0B domain-containing protein [Peptococcaceae bacterium]
MAFLQQMLEAHRTLRHDFMNDLQVILGYLQMGQEDKARDYVRKAAASLEGFHSLARIKLPALQSLLTCFLTSLHNERVFFAVEIEDDLGAWEEDDIILTRLLQKLLTVLGEEIPEKNLKTRLQVTGGPSVYIEVFSPKSASVGKVLGAVCRLQKKFRGRFALLVKKEEENLILLEIIKRKA